MITDVIKDVILHINITRSTLETTMEEICLIDIHNATAQSNVSMNGSGHTGGGQLFVVAEQPEPPPYAHISHILSSRVAVAICGIGIIGNLLTFILLIHRRKVMMFIDTREIHV